MLSPWMRKILTATCIHITISLFSIRTSFSAAGTTVFKITFNSKNYTIKVNEIVHVNAFMGLAWWSGIEIITIG